MKIEELRRIKNQRPFTPFGIRTADGSDIEIRHPDAVSWSNKTSPRIVHCYSQGEEFWIDIALATAIHRPQPATPEGGNGPEPLRDF